MAESRHDSTAEQREARTATWCDDATRAPGSRGLPLTIFHQGRYLRFHADGRLEDLGPEDWEPAAEDIPLAAALAAPATFVLPRDDIPEPFRELAETVATLAKASLDTTDAADASVSTEPSDRSVAAEDAVDCDDQVDEDPGDADPEGTGTDAAQSSDGTFAAAAAGTTEYNFRIMEAACINANAMLAFASALLRAKSLSDMVVITTAHARKQIEAAADQTKQLAAAAHKMTPKNPVQVD